MIRVSCLQRLLFLIGLCIIWRMAVEDLIHPTFTGDQLRIQADREISSRGQTVGSGTRIMYLAKMFRDESRSGLLSITRVLQQELGELPELNDTSVGILEKKRLVYPTRSNLVGLAIGTVIPCLVNTLSEKVSDIGDLTAQYNLGVTGTLLRSTEISGVEVTEELSDTQWHDMLRVASQDPTLAAFFSFSNRKILPDNLTVVLDRNLFHPENEGAGITFTLISAYSALARTLIYG